MSDPANPLARLEALPRFAVSGAGALKPGLERITALLAVLGNPHRVYPVVHVAGTNGKGSTASMIAAIATAAGIRTGLHTSPHLLDVTERFRVDGIPVDSAWLIAAVERLEPHFETVNPSYFEVTVALAFEWFREAAVELAVIETGLGGRLDATNVVSPVVSVITDLAMDHAEVLGGTIQAIAFEKAGIIKDRIPVVASDSGAEVSRVFREVATARSAPLEIIRDIPRRKLDLAGSHQLRNAALAVAAARRLTASGPPFDRIDEAAIERGLAQTIRYSGLRGRFEVLSERPFVAVDVAHNPDGLSTALATFDERCTDTGSKRILAFAVMADKDVVAMARLIAAAGVTVLPVRLKPGRALEMDLLVRVLQETGCTMLESLPDAAMLPDWFARHLTERDAALVAGSFYLAGPFLAAWPAAGPQGPAGG